MTKLMTLNEIDCCQRIGRDEQARVSRIGLTELDTLCATARAALIPFEATKKHNHYFKDVSTLNTVDVYRILKLFNVTDPCLQHATKKLLVAGGRGAGKDIDRDVQEAIDTLLRWQEMRREDAASGANETDPRAK